MDREELALAFGFIEESLGSLTKRVLASLHNQLNVYNWSVSISREALKMYLCARMFIFNQSFVPSLVQV